MDRRDFFKLSAPTVVPRDAEGPAPPPPLGLSSGLEPYPEALDKTRAAHLLRRTGFGANPAAVSDLTGQNASSVVDDLILQATDRPLPPPPYWATTPPPPRGSPEEDFEAYAADNQIWRNTYVDEWMVEMIDGGLRERMTLFWSNHFVTGIDVYFLAPFAYRYLTLLRTHALGNFRELLYEIGRDPAMLVYLNGNANQKSAPNENYARELLELFTMGPSTASGEQNYTQQDITEIARALTGWVVDYYQLLSYFVGFVHDYGQKTIFGRTDAFGYDEVVDLLFEERGPAIAEFLSRKLYKTFVYAGPDEAVVSALADTLLQHDFDLAPTLAMLLKSAHFFDAQVIGAAVKSPVALQVGMQIESHAPFIWDRLTFMQRGAFLSGQRLLNPPNVAGWPGHHAWLSTTTLPIRWILSELMLYGPAGRTPLNLVPLAAEVHDPNDPFAAFYLPTALAEHLFAVSPALLDIGEVAEPFGGDLEAFPIPDDIENGLVHVRTLSKIFLGGIPWYEWSIYSDSANLRLLAFLRYLSQLPEFQLT